MEIPKIQPIFKRRFLVDVEALEVRINDFIQNAEIVAIYDSTEFPHDLGITINIFKNTKESVEKVVMREVNLEELMNIIHEAIKMKLPIHLQGIEETSIRINNPN